MFNMIIGKKKIKCVCSSHLLYKIWGAFIVNDSPTLKYSRELKFPPVCCKLKMLALLKRNVDCVIRCSLKLSFSVEIYNNFNN